MFSSFALKKLECKCYQWCESETNIFILGQKTMKKVRVWVMKFFSPSPWTSRLSSQVLWWKRGAVGGSQLDSLFDQRSCHFFWQGHPDNQGWQLSLRSKLKLISSQNILWRLILEHHLSCFKERMCVWFSQICPTYLQKFWLKTLLGCDIIDLVGFVQFWKGKEGDRKAE